MYRALRSAVRVTFSPDAEWRTIKGEEPRARTIFAFFVLPLALIPAVSWSLGLLLFGNDAGSGALDFGQIARGGLIAYLSMALSICLYAASIVALAPLFGCPRDWSRALQVAAHSAAPVLIGGLVLVLPNVAFVLLLPFLHSLYLQYAGLQQVLAVKESAAAEYVALSNMLLMVLATALGPLGTWLGIL